MERDAHGRAFLPDHKQRALRRTPVWLYSKLFRALSRRQYRRMRNADFVYGEPYFLQKLFAVSPKRKVKISSSKRCAQLRIFNYFNAVVPIRFIA